MVEELGVEALAAGSHFHWPGDNPIKTPGLDNNLSADAEIIQSKWDGAVEPGLQLLATSQIGHTFTFLRERGIEAYIVGGFIRDFLMGRPSDDIDLAVKANSKTVAIELAGKLGGKFVPLDAERGIYRLVLEEKNGQLKIDISSVEKDIYRDLSRRDFTIDAMAFAIEPSNLKAIKSDGKITSGSIIDPFNGQADLKSHILRAVDKSVFLNDPARLLRAYRLAAEMGLTIDENTEGLIQENSLLVKNVAGERIREELLGILSRKRTEESLRKMDSLGLLDNLFPELTPAKGVAQPGWHVYDVFEHSLATVYESERILQSQLIERQSDPLLSYLNWDRDTDEYFKEEIAQGSPRYALSKLAGLFHDIAKPQTKSLTQDGFAHFYGHTKIGADITRAIMERLRFSNREMDLVEIMVENHLRPTQMGDGSGDGRPGKKAIYRFFRDTKDASLDILCLSLADYLASKGKEVDRKDWQAKVDAVHYILKTHNEMQIVTKTPRLLNGHDLMKEFSLSPGPVLGDLLEKVEEARVLGQISTKEEALSFVGKILKEKK